MPEPGGSSGQLGFPKTSSVDHEGCQPCRRRVRENPCIKLNSVERLYKNLGFSDVTPEFDLDQVEKDERRYVSNELIEDLVKAPGVDSIRLAFLELQ